MTFFGIATIVGSWAFGYINDHCKRWVHVLFLTSCLAISYYLAYTAELFCGEHCSIGYDEGPMLANTLLSMFLGGMGDAGLNSYCYSVIGYWFPSGVRSARGIAGFKFIQSIIGYVGAFLYTYITTEAGTPPLEISVGLLSLNCLLLAVGAVTACFVKEERVVEFAPAYQKPQKDEYGSESE